MTSRRGEASSSSSRDSGVQRLPRLPVIS
jgi:hypothetical protein